MTIYSGADSPEVRHGLVNQFASRHNKVTTEDVIVVSAVIEQKELEEISKKRFGDMVKAVVDIERAVMALGGELHADEEAVLLDNGSQQGNRSRGIDDDRIRQKIAGIVNKLIRG